MAYFSDTQDTPAKRGFVPPQSDDERRLMRRVEELCRVAQSRGIPRYTGFLSDREQSLAQAACNKAGRGCTAFAGITISFSTASWGPSKVRPKTRLCGL